MTRRQRERAILALIAARPMETQQELVAGLLEGGLEVTQATVSRDIQRLGLVKVRQGAGGHRYALPQAPAAPPGASQEQLLGMLQSYVTSMEEANAMLVLKCRSGRASAVASAIDEVPTPEIVATLAGDDTILLLLRSADDREKVRDALGKLL